ncbi:unnamed protein product [Vitrella brassicaformis CCMP3155]|uniref:Uncharacterized protein n=1 Tax=Vitrella brassicaformis (strain CCMP3155) TaxID=1169540 RepID=A0A0G4GWN9_VITBC|nr:unnamed protein product [Vitrella brassicaformis CCMP3155]|eukprot:CEM35183.1 unnamed protein product [Vitrella brassicaformis CCMP3155]
MQARWHEGGRERTKSFPINEDDPDKALQEAIAYRQAMVALHNQPVESVAAEQPDEMSVDDEEEEMVSRKTRKKRRKG